MTHPTKSRYTNRSRYQARLPAGETAIAPGWPKKLRCLICRTLRTATHAGDRLCKDCKLSANRHDTPFLV